MNELLQQLLTWAREPKTLTIRSQMLADYIKKHGGPGPGDYGSGEGYSFPLPGGLGGIMLLNPGADEQRNKVVLNHEKQHIRAGMDGLQHSIIDALAYITSPDKDIAQPYRPPPGWLATAYQNSVDRGYPNQANQLIDIWHGSPQFRH
jgi:hypothetical protein